MFAVLLIYFGIPAWSQYDQPFDFLEANRQFMNAQRSLGKLNGVAGFKQTECSEKVNLKGETEMSCNLRPTDYDDNLILKIDYLPEQLPQSLREQLPLEFLKDYKKKISCVFTIGVANDNQQMLGRRAEQHIKNSTYGDDFYRTHYFDTGVACTDEDRIRTTYMYSTELFSDPDRMSARRESSGNVSMKQRFTSENIFAMIQDNIQQNNVTYWKQGVGFINLSQKKKWGLAQSTGQQEWFHEQLNSIKNGRAYDYQYIEGTKDSWTPFITTSLGLQMQKKFGDRCRINTAVEGTALVAANGQSQISAEANAKISYTVTPMYTSATSLYLRTYASQTIRKDSSTGAVGVAAGIETVKGSSLEVGVEKPIGNRQDVPDKPNVYTGRNDLQVRIRVKYALD